MDFVFVNVQKPSDALQLAKESSIRSHVTRVQWKKAERHDKRSKKRILLRGAGAFQDNVVCLMGQDSVSPQIGGLRNDPFESYPISAQPWTPLLVDHCKFV